MIRLFTDIDDVKKIFTGLDNVVFTTLSESNIIISNDNIKTDKIINHFPFDELITNRTTQLELFTFYDYFDIIPFCFGYIDKKTSFKNIKLYDFIKEHRIYESIGKKLWLTKPNNVNNININIFNINELINKIKNDEIKDVVIQKLIEYPLLIEHMNFNIKIQICFLPVIDDNICIGYDIYLDPNIKLLYNDEVKDINYLDKFLNVKQLIHLISKSIERIFDRRILNKVNPNKQINNFEVINMFYTIDKNMNCWITDINITNKHNFYPLIFNIFFKSHNKYEFTKLSSIYYNT